VRPFSEEKRGRRQGGSTVPEANDTTKSGAVAGEAEGGNWRLEIEDE
jgi:subtilisin-like proprotein convertase family protein